MPGANTRTQGRRIFPFWRLLAVTGLMVGVASLFRSPREISGRGQPSVPPSAKSLGEGFEAEDISARQVAIILGILAATTAAVIGIVLIMGWRFEVSRNASNAVLTPEQTARVTPPSPHLQNNPFDDLARVQSRESRMLNTYGWINADHTRARIPIARAREISVGKSLDAGP